MQRNIGLYSQKIADTQIAIAARKQQLSLCSDPLVRLSLERAVAGLEEMLTVFVATREALSDLKAIDERSEARGESAP